MSRRVNKGDGQLGEQALEPVPNVAQRGQVTGELNERRMHGQEGTDGHLARQPLLGVIVQTAVPIMTHATTGAGFRCTSTLLPAAIRTASSQATPC